MIVIFSGEGPTDLGRCSNDVSYCRKPEFEHGPMSVVADKILEKHLGYSPLGATPESCCYVSKTYLVERAKAPERKRKVSLRGKKGPEVETNYFYMQAWMFGLTALEIEAEDDHSDSSIAILFRDCDGSRATARGLWDKKLESMHQGFARAGYDCGVPMLPKPISEAWLLCSAQDTPHHQCELLEELSGSEKARHPLKARLEDAMQGDSSAQAIVDWLDNGGADIEKWVSMASFAAFKARLEDVIKIA